jgi:hypothetical protein
MLGEGQLIKEVKLEGTNHDKMRKWVKTVYMPERHIIGRSSGRKGRPVPLKGCL